MIRYENVVEAAHRLTGVAHRTPVLHSRTFDQRVGASVCFKAECFQRTGSFKFRGAFNAVSRHVERCQETGHEPGIVTYSSGNHAQAVALAGSLLSVPVVVVMPEDAPAAKLGATRGYGAEVILYDRFERAREAVGEALARERGLELLPPYDHEDVIAGQGTTALELLEEVPDLSLLVVCLGGGGLLSGCALAVKGARPPCRIVGVEPAAADDGARSFRSGRIETVENPATIADGARTPSLGRLTFPIIQRLVDDIVTVPDEALLEAMRFLWSRMKVVVEPTGALATAALLSGVIEAPGGRVGVTLTGGNVDLGQAATWLAAPVD